MPQQGISRRDTSAMVYARIIRSPRNLDNKDRSIDSVTDSLVHINWILLVNGVKCDSGKGSTSIDKNDGRNVHWCKRS